MLLEAARESEKESKSARGAIKKTARAFENRAQFGARNPDTGVINNPLMLAAARYFDRRSQKIKSREIHEVILMGGIMSSNEAI